MKVCFVAPPAEEAASLPAADLTDRLLAGRGWQTHLLVCGDGEETPLQRFGGDDPALVRGEQALEELVSLQAEHGFDLIEFCDAGLAARSVQAKRLGGALLDARLAVNLRAPAFWQRRRLLGERTSPRDLKLDHCERYAFEWADFQIAPSRHMLERARREEWAVRDDAFVVHPLPEPGGEVALAEIGEIAFLGPLPDDGLPLLLAALDEAAPGVPVVFFGEDEPIGDVAASELIGTRLGDRPHRIVPGLDAAALRAELAAGDKLVVHAGRGDPFGFAVAESALAGVPFLAARKGGVPELFGDAPGAEGFLFEPAPPVLAAAIERRLALSLEAERELRAAVAAVHNPEDWADSVESRYRELLQRPWRPRLARISEAASVTVTIAHYNHDRYLPGALASLAAQTRPPEEVIVVDDGSTSEAARRVFAEQEARYPEWTFVRQENAGPGHARNSGLERASGAYFLPFDSDNVAAPDLVERLLAALETNSSLAAVTCHNLAFVEDADIEVGRFAFRYSPTGGPRVLACLENVYGDTCSLFRTEELRRVGGFEINRWSPTEDWETFVKMATAGLELDVFPRPLFYYRTDSGGRLQSVGNDRLTTLRLRAHLVETFFVNAELSRSERRQLFECLQAFDHSVTEGMARRLAEQRRWHDSQMADLDAFREDQLAERDEQMSAAVDAERTRAEAAEAELASLRAVASQGLLRRAADALRGRVPGSGGR